MNKKLTFPGIEPDITFDNILRDPIANRAALFGIISGLAGSSDVKISGAVVTIDPLVDADVTAGYVWLNGEILQVDAAAGVEETQGTDLWEFQKQVTYDSAGDKTFGDSVPRQTYQKNRAILVNVATITGMDAVNADSFNDLLSRVKQNEADIISLNADTGDLDFISFATEVSFINYQQIRQVGREVHANLGVTITPDISSGIVCSLPTAIGSPASDIRIVWMELNTGVIKSAFIDASARTVTIGGGSNTGLWLVSFNYST